MAGSTGLARTGAKGTGARPTVNSSPCPLCSGAFEATLFALEQALARLAELDKEIEALAQTAPTWMSIRGALR